jgi:hypothetical protein
MADTVYGIYRAAAIVTWFALLACGVVLGLSRTGALTFAASLAVFLLGHEVGYVKQVIIGSVLFVPLIVWPCLGYACRWPFKRRREVLLGEKGTDKVDFRRVAVYEDSVVVGDQAKKYWAYQVMAAVVCYVLLLTATLKAAIRLFAST